ncbi:MAG: hypothetical protein V1820_00955 [archaeon]
MCELQIHGAVGGRIYRRVAKAFEILHAYQELEAGGRPLLSKPKHELKL